MRLKDASKVHGGKKLWNLRSSLLGYVGIWREILDFWGEGLSLYVHKNIQIVFKFGGLLAGEKFKL